MHNAVTIMTPHASAELVLTLFHQIYNYALANDICGKDYPSFVSIHIEDDDIVEMILIMCYFGFRIATYKNLKTDLTVNYSQDGVKTHVGKDRIVPIHSSIQSLVKRRLDRDGMYHSLQIFREIEELRKQIEKIDVCY